MRTDLLLDEYFDLIEDATTNDFVEGVSDDQHVQLITLCNKGEFKESPYLGFGVVKRLKSKVNEVAFRRDLAVELESDGYNNVNIITGENLSQLTVEIPYT